LLAVGGAIVALIIVALVVRHGRPGTDRTNGAVSRVADPTPTPSASAPAVARSPATDRSRPPNPNRAGAAGGGEMARAETDSERPKPGPGGRAIRRYAQTWVNVRGDRTRSAPTVAMLNPGDSVTVDSLVRGWYRVLVDGRTLGYVHRFTLDVSRPE
jgi:hypothetical protein